MIFSSSSAYVLYLLFLNNYFSKKMFTLIPQTNYLILITGPSQELRLYLARHLTSLFLYLGFTSKIFSPIADLRRNRRFPSQRDWVLEVLEGYFKEETCPKIALVTEGVNIRGSRKGVLMKVKGNDFKVIWIESGFSMEEGVNLAINLIKERKQVKEEDNNQRLIDFCKAKWRKTSFYEEILMSELEETGHSLLRLENLKRSKEDMKEDGLKGIIIAFLDNWSLKEYLTLEREFYERKTSCLQRFFKAIINEKEGLKLLKGEKVGYLNSYLNGYLYGKGWNPVKESDFTKNYGYLTNEEDNYVIEGSKILKISYFFDDFKEEKYFF